LLPLKAARSSVALSMAPCALMRATTRGVLIDSVLATRAVPGVAA
jgi:hypothetical protein